MRKSLLLLGVPLILSLSACAKATPPTKTIEDLGDVIDVFDDAQGLTATTTAAMPTTGSATYTGNMSTTSSTSDGLIGDMVMDADFSSGDVTGTISNLNLLADSTDLGGDQGDVASQLLGGQLTINGTITGASLDGTANGDLTGVATGIPVLNSATVTFDTDLDITGNFLSSNPGTAEADVIQGNLTGTLSATALGQDLGTKTYNGTEMGYTVCTSDCATLLNP